MSDKSYVIDQMISAKSIAARIEELAVEIEQEFSDTDKLIVVGLLRGSFVFIADLVREINLPIEVDFLEVSSYGDGMESSREVRILKDLRGTIENRDVLIVEDIVDTGNTISSVFEKIQAHQPKSIEVTTLLFKPKVYNKKIPIKYPVINVGNEFLVGFGLDYNGIGRNLEDIYIIEEKN